MATFSKLKDGSWGVKAEPDLAGEIAVTRKAGDVTHVTLDKQVWSNGTVALYSIISDPKPGYTPSKPITVRCSCGGGDCRCGPECNCRGGNIYDC